MNYIRQAKRIKGATGNILLQLLEMRLDNVIFRLGMAPTIAAARQIVTHKHIKLIKVVFQFQVTNVNQAMLSV